MYFVKGRACSYSIRTFVSTCITEKDKTYILLGIQLIYRHIIKVRNVPFLPTQISMAFNQCYMSVAHQLYISADGNKDFGR